VWNQKQADIVPPRGTAEERKFPEPVGTCR
jgi:hypothetical protein